MNNIANDLVFFIDRNLLNNSYLLINNDKCLVIDPSFNDTKINEYLNQHQLKLEGIILTHGHYDHIGNSFLLAKQCGINVWVHTNEKPIIEKWNYAKELNIQLKIDNELIQYFNSSILKIGNFEFDVLLTSGHTPGGVCLKYKNYVFSGDTIFYETIGRTDLHGGNMNQMYNSIHLFLKKYHDNDLILPGHGQYGTLKEIKEVNNYLKQDCYYDVIGGK